MRLMHFDACRSRFVVDKIMNETLCLMNGILTFSALNHLIQRVLNCIQFVYFTWSCEIFDRNLVNFFDHFFRQRFKAKAKTNMPMAIIDTVIKYSNASFNANVIQWLFSHQNRFFNTNSSSNSGKHWASMAACEQNFGIAIRITLNRLYFRK